LIKHTCTGLYKGVQSPLAGQALFNAWQFFVYGYAQKVILGHDAPAGSRLTIPQYFVVGALTGGLISVIEAPQDLFKSQMQVQVFKEKPSFTSVWGCVRHIWHEGGVRGVYQGLGATVARNIPSVSGYFGVYESMRNYLTPVGGTVADLSSSKLLLAGGLGGLCYWSATYPLDVIKSSMQGDATLKSERKYKNIVDCARQLYAQGGSKAFFRGYAPCLLRAFPANAACFFGYEKTRELLSKI